MNYHQQTGKTIYEAFAEFDLMNPVIYEMFREYALYLIRERGKSRIGAKMIMEHIRWEIYIKSADNDYKINNNFTAHYVRKFLQEFPQYRNYFELRKVDAPNSEPVQTELF